MKRHLFRAWLVIAIVLSFAAVIFLSLWYLNSNILCDLECQKRDFVVIILVLLPIVGIIVGSSTYYFMAEQFQKKLDKVHRDMSSLYRLLEADERDVIMHLVAAGGKDTQSNISGSTRLSRVKVSRVLGRLEQKKVITRTGKGMTKEVVLDAKLNGLLK